MTSFSYKTLIERLVMRGDTKIGPISVLGVQKIKNNTYDFKLRATLDDTVKDNLPSVSDDPIIFLAVIQRKSVMTKIVEEISFNEEEETKK